MLTSRRLHSATQAPCIPIWLSFSPVAYHTTEDLGVSQSTRVLWQLCLGLSSGTPQTGTSLAVLVRLNASMAAQIKPGEGHLKWLFCLSRPAWHQLLLTALKIYPSTCAECLTQPHGQNGESRSVVEKERRYCNRLFLFSFHSRIFIFMTKVSPCLQ